MHFLKFIVVGNLLSHTKSITEQECIALESFYNSTRGDMWGINTNWPHSTSTPNVTCNDICHNNTIPYGVQCDDQYHIYALSMTDNNLTGTIPDSISNLQYLSQLSIVSEPYNLQGFLPNSTFDIISLKQINLELVSLSVEISSKFCNLINLEHFVVFSYATLHGTIPNCVENMIHLTKMQLGASDIMQMSSHDSNMYRTIYSDSDGTRLGNQYLTGTIPNALVNLPNISMIEFIGLAIEGPLPQINKNIDPDEFFEFKLNTFSVSNDVSYPWKTTLNESFCTMIANVQYIQLLTNAIYGTLPQCIFNNIAKPSLYLDLSYNSLTGTIPQFNFNITNCDNMVIDFSSNKLTGTVPDWMTKCQNSTFQLGNNSLTGTIPSNWSTNSYFALSNNRLHGTIPSDLWISNPCDHITQHRSLQYQFNDNQLSGTFPANLINDFNKCDNKIINIWIDLSHNKMQHFPFCDIKSVKLKRIFLNKNIIVENDISQSLNCLFANNSNISKIFLHNNPFIQGDISKINLGGGEYENQLQARKLGQLTLHDCDISGRLPDRLNLSNMSAFTIFNNRISCKLPNNVASYYDSHAVSTDNPFLYLILLGNLFDVEKLDAKNQYHWLKYSEFVNAVNLYLTEDDRMVLIVLLVVTCFAGVIILLRTMFYLFGKLKIRKVKHTSRELENENVSNLFVNFMNYVCGMLSNPLLLLISIILVVMYYFNSNYYQCGRITSHFGLNYFQFSWDQQHSTTDKTVIEMTILLCTIGFNGIFLFKLQQLKKTLKQMSNDYYNKNNCFHNNNNNGTNSKNSRTICTCTPLFGWLGWLCCYLTGAILATIYIIVQSLPTPNIFNINAYWQQKSIDYLLGIDIALINIYVVPRLIDSSFGVLSSPQLQKNVKSYTNFRAYGIVFLRSMLSIFIPLIISLMFLNKCGNLWALLWNTCAKDSDTFNASLMNPDTSTRVYLLTHKSVCGVKSFLFPPNKLQIGQCLRSFYDQWIPIIIIKLTVVIINPWILMFITKYFKYKIKTLSMCCCCCWCFRSKTVDNHSTENRASLMSLNDDVGPDSHGRVETLDEKDKNNSNQSNPKNNIQIKIDSAYSMIAIKLEICLFFSLISPFVLWMTFCAIFSNWLAFRIMQKRLSWRLVSGSYFNGANCNENSDNKRDLVFPVFSIVMSLWLQQIMIALLCWTMFSLYITIIWIVVNILLDFLYIFISCKKIKHSALK